MSTPQQIAAARSAAAAERLCGTWGDDAMGEPLHADLDRGDGEHLTRALGFIHAITRDPGVLTEGATRLTTEPRTPGRVYALRLMVAAGADEEQARQIMARRGKGWVTPQAEAWKPSD